MRGISIEKAKKMKKKVVRKKLVKNAQVQNATKAVAAGTKLPMDTEHGVGAKRVAMALIELTELGVIKWLTGAHCATACVEMRVDNEGAGNLLCFVSLVDVDGVGGSAETICDLNRTQCDELMDGITRSPLTKEVGGNLC